MKAHRKHPPENTPVKPRHPRVIARGDGFRVVAIGRRREWLGDMYVRLLGASWKAMAAMMCALYLAINLAFALAYLSIGDGLANARPGSFADAFFFSVQTLATIGYGGITPHGAIANLLVTLESLFGFAFYGVVTGLVFSKFSRPTARVLFSDKAIITAHDGRPHFMLRLANERNNRIVDASVKLTLMRDETTLEGNLMRRFYDLPLVRREIPVLRLTWTVMHFIDEHSPLYQVTPEKLAAAETEIIVSLQGIDETLSQTIHARHSYITDEIVCDAAFEDVLHRRADYVLEVRYDRFHQLKRRSRSDAA
jgi:inward rectifier potassium channel